MAGTRTAEVVVIGAGIAGLCAARALHGAGRDVVVLEKSRGFGGRAASRTVDGVRVDHGAQFVSVRDERFRRQVDAWLAEGTMALWTRGMARWTAADGWSQASPDAHPRYACPAGMNALGKSLASGLLVERESLVRHVRPGASGWTVELDGGATRHARHVIVSAPVPQALTLIEDESLAAPMRRDLAALSYAPCHAVIAHFEDETPPPWSGVQLPEHAELAWIANDTSRRRPLSSRGATLVLHMSANASRARFDDDPMEVTRALLEAASPLLPWRSTPTWTRHHRWRFALAERLWPEHALALAPGLVLCGDAFGDGRVEGAYLSGLAAATLV